MPAIASIAVSVKARTEQFERGLRRARRRLSDFANRVRATAKRVAMLGSVVAAAAVAIGTVMVKAQMAAADSLGKVADSVRTTTESLAGLRLAAKLSGVETKRMDKALQYMVRNIGEAQAGTAEIAKAFELLGIDILKLVRMKASDQFALIADKINLLGTHTERAYAANKIFGRSGVELLAMMRMGSKEFAEVTERAKRYGIAISRIDTRMIEAANDAITEMRHALEGVARRIAVGVSPYIEAMAQRLTGAMTAGRNLGDVIVDSFERATLALIEFGQQLRVVAANAKKMHIDWTQKRVDILRRQVQQGRVLETQWGLRADPRVSHPRLDVRMQVVNEAQDRVNKMISELSKDFRDFDAEVAGAKKAFRDIRRNAERMSQQKQLKLDIEDWIIRNLRPALGPLAAFMQGLPFMPIGQLTRLQQDTTTPTITSAARRLNEFQAISLSRMALPGLAEMQRREQRVEDIGTHKALERLIRETARRKPTLAG